MAAAKPKGGTPSGVREVSSSDTASRLVRAIWPWVPAFKVVAETEHLPTAASRLHLTPSALSRTVRLLEDAVGQQLFLRSSRRISLNAGGKRLLAAVQRATWSLEEAVPRALGPGHVGDFQVSALGVLTDYFVLPSLLVLAAQHEGVVPSLTTWRSRDANRRVANGELAVAFYYDATSHPGVRCERLGTITSSVYCGVGHPLFRERRVTRARLLEHSFSAPGLGDRGTRMDGWPIDVPRRVGLEITLLSTNLAVALSGRYVTVLPDVVARPHLDRRELRRLPVAEVAAVEAYAALRDGDASELTRELVSAVTARLDSAAEDRLQERTMSREARDGAESNAWSLFRVSLTLA